MLIRGRIAKLRELVGQGYAASLSISAVDGRIRLRCVVQPHAAAVDPIIAQRMAQFFAELEPFVEQWHCVDRGHCFSNGVKKVIVWCKPPVGPNPGPPGWSGDDGSAPPDDHKGAHKPNERGQRDFSGGPSSSGSAGQDPWSSGCDPWSKRPRTHGSVVIPGEVDGHSPGRITSSPLPTIPYFPFKFQGIENDSVAFLRQSEGRILHALQAIDERLESATAGLVVIANHELRKLDEPCMTHDLAGDEATDIENIYDCDFVSVSPPPGGLCLPADAGLQECGAAVRIQAVYRGVLDRRKAVFLRLFRDHLCLRFEEIHATIASICASCNPSDQALPEALPLRTDGG